MQVTVDVYETDNHLEFDIFKSMKNETITVEPAVGESTNIIAVYLSSQKQ